MAEFKTEPLGKFTITVSDDHTFGTDAVLLADFAARHVSKLACDLGTGCGIIPLLLLKSERANRVFGVEIQKEGAALAALNAEKNGITDKLSALCLDLKEVKGNLPQGAFDLVTCNPPYNADGSGNKNENGAKKIARHETMCSFSDVVSAAKYLLKYGGRFCVCNRPERLGDMICEMHLAGIEPKVLREVIQRKGKAAWLVLLEGKVGAKPGMEIMPPLFVEENGELSDEMMQIYGDYKDGKSRNI